MRTVLSAASLRCALRLRRRPAHAREERRGGTAATIAVLSSLVAESVPRRAAARLENFMVGAAAVRLSLAVVSEQLQRARRVGSARVRQCKPREDDDELFSQAQQQCAQRHAR
jgi:hypothetical protein